MVSRKNEANVIVKNMLDVALGGVAFWFFGFGLGFGPNTHGTNRMSGASNYFFWNLIDVDKEGMTYAQLFFQMSFATTATTIVSGNSKVMCFIWCECIFSKYKALNRTLL